MFEFCPGQTRFWTGLLDWPTGNCIPYYLIRKLNEALFLKVQYFIINSIRSELVKTAYASDELLAIVFLCCPITFLVHHTYAINAKTIIMTLKSCSNSIYA